MPKKRAQDEKIQEAKRLINLNEDSRQYFFEKADETWLVWLKENNFFDVLKEKADDLGSFSFKTPELRYLIKMVEFKPEVVTQIIIDTPVSKETFNPEVIDQFLRICSNLPGEHLAKLTRKIKTENWPALMQMYNQWGIEYEKMFESLAESNFNEEIMDLASAVLSLRDNWTTQYKEEDFDFTPFCLKNLSYSKVFHYLSSIKDDCLEDAIDLSLSILTRLTIKSDNPAPFTRKDAFPLYSTDVFTIGLTDKHQDSGSDNIKEVIALIKSLTERALLHDCIEKADVIFEQHFKSLPDSWLLWRVRLFVLSLCPSRLMSQLKETLFRIFKEDNYSELIMGAEYRKALMKSFPFMHKEDQTQFVNSAKDLFSNISKEDKNSLNKRDGSRIFSVIAKSLSDNQLTELENAGFDINPNAYPPTPIIGTVTGGFVDAKGPVTQEEFQAMPISTIVDNLKNVWSPKSLVNQDTQVDFLNPINAEGMGKLIREDVKKRLKEYLEYASEFLDHKNVDPHYLFSLLYGLTDAINENKKPLNNTAWKFLIAFCLKIIQSIRNQSMETLEYEVRENNTWLGRWNAVCSAMEDLLEKTLSSKGQILGFEWKSHRNTILLIIKYLFEYPDPVPEDESIESAKMTEAVGWQEPTVSDPFTIAINSIRGQAYEIFTLAVGLDTKSDREGKNTEINNDLKIMYKTLLDHEETRAIMFLFGHYVPFFYYKDKNWLKSNLYQIFPTEKEKKYQYLAAWEGFLTNNLFVDMFKEEEFQSLYKRAIVMTEKEYPHQKHFTDPDEGVAKHLALAYMTNDFDTKNTVFDFFWRNGNLTQHTTFIDKLGKSFITTKNEKVTSFITTNEIAKKKLIDLWEWLLQNYTDPGVFNGIGFWINLDKEIFQAEKLAKLLKSTLKQTNGYLQWYIGLKDNIVELAKQAPEDTVEILRLYLLVGGVRNKLNTFYFILQDEWVTVFDILYSTEVSKQATISLINDLIKEGGSSFWPLKKVLT